MFCQYCGCELVEGGSFCTNCGKAILYPNQNNVSNVNNFNSLQWENGIGNDIIEKSEEQKKNKILLISIVLAFMVIIVTAIIIVVIYNKKDNNNSQIKNTSQTNVVEQNNDTTQVNDNTELAYNDETYSDEVKQVSNYYDSGDYINAYKTGKELLQTIPSDVSAYNEINNTVNNSYEKCKTEYIEILKQLYNDDNRDEYSKYISDLRDIFENDAVAINNLNEEISKFSTMHLISGINNGSCTINYDNYNKSIKVDGAEDWDMESITDPALGLYYGASSSSSFPILVVFDDSDIDYDSIISYSYGSMDYNYNILHDESGRISEIYGEYVNSENEIQNESYKYIYDENNNCVQIYLDDTFSYYFSYNNDKIVHFEASGSGLTYISVDYEYDSEGRVSYYSGKDWGGNIECSITYDDLIVYLNCSNYSDYGNYTNNYTVTYDNAGRCVSIERSGDGYKFWSTYEYVDVPIKEDFDALIR